MKSILNKTKRFRIPFELKQIPSSSGVYFFCASDKTVLYVGKAMNVRERLRSYLHAFAGTKQARIVRESRTVRIEKTNSDIDALVKESAYIKKYRPKYNVVLKDDKNYFYLCFVSVRDARDFPRIWITHQPSKYPGAQSIGPFVDGTILKHTLRMVRLYFPFCTCKHTHARMCLYAHIGWCPGVCCAPCARPTVDDARTYAKNILYIKHIFLGQDKKLAAMLKKRITDCIRLERYDEAGRLKKQLEGLTRIFSHQGIAEQSNNDSGNHGACAWLAERCGVASVTKIEMLDTSMLQGSDRSGVVTVFDNTIFDPSRYRRFVIRGTFARDDISMMREVLERRLKHTEWTYPDVFFVDGGIAQFRMARDVLKRYNLAIPVCALTKDSTHRLVSVLIQKGSRILSRRVASFPHGISRFFLEFSDRTHAYAIRQFRKRHTKSFIV